MRIVQPGDVIGGKYSVERIIGRGGVGIIAAARHVTLKQRVALKFLRPEVAGDPDIIQRFLREAQAAAQIRSEHVTRVMDAGTMEDGTVFLVFEYLAGRDLAAVLREDGPLAIADAVDYLTQACEAVAEAHALGIVHRDLKPANLFLTRAPDGAPLVKVLDFGLSKVKGSAAMTALTAANHVIGSPHFMSPEQMRSSRDADARSDIWALGVVLFGLLTGRVPFEGEYLTEVCAAVLEGKALSLRGLRPDAPLELEAVILRCLRTEPAERFQSVPELVEALRPFASEGGQARVERIARVVDATQRSLGPNANTLPLDGSPHPVSAGSSPVSWSISVTYDLPLGGAVEMTSPPERGDDGAPARVSATRAANPELTNASATTQPKRDARAPGRSKLLMTAALSLLAGAAGLAWIGQGAARQAVPRAASTSLAAPAITTSHAPALVSRPAPIASDHPATAAPPRGAPKRSTAEPRARPSSPRSSAPNRPAVVRAPLPQGPPSAQTPPPTPVLRDEELILDLPH